MWHFIWCRCFAWHRIASSQCWMDLARSTETLTWQARNQMTLKIRIFLPNKAFPSAKNCGENVASKNVGMPTMCISWGKTLEKPCKVLLHGVDVRLALVILGLGVNASEQPYNRQMTIHGIPNWIPFFQRKLLIKTIAGSSDLVREPKNMAKKQIMGGLRVGNGEWYQLGHIGRESPHDLHQCWDGHKFWKPRTSGLTYNQTQSYPLPSNVQDPIRLMIEGLILSNIPIHQTVNWNECGCWTLFNHVQS